MPGGGSFIDRVDIPHRQLALSRARRAPYFPGN
jgi:hypothetical protein